MKDWQFILAVLLVCGGYMMPLWILFWKPWIDDMNKRKKELAERIKKRNEAQM